MRKFAAGVTITLILLGVGLLIWYGLNDQARGLVVGVLLGIIGLAAGVILAFAVVGIFLLINLRWSVTSATAPPVLHGSPPLPLDLPRPVPQGWRRREWDVVGAEDVQEEGAFRFVR